jgi:hypothetical protein
VWAAGQSVMRWRCRGWARGRTHRKGSEGSLKAPLNALDWTPCEAHREEARHASMRSPAQPAAQLRISPADPRIPGTQTRPWRRRANGPRASPHDGQRDGILETHRDESRIRGCSREFWAAGRTGQLRSTPAMKQAVSRISQPMARGRVRAWPSDDDRSLGSQGPEKPSQALI